MFYTLVYISRANKGMNQNKLEQILKISRENNKAANIGGMLLYRDGEFMQVLEGEHQTLMALLKRIEGDKRHHDIIVLSRKEVATRHFKEWGMNFDNLSGKELPGLIDPTSFFAEGNNFEQGNTAFNFLAKFYKG